MKIETENADDSEQPADFGCRFSTFDLRYESAPDAGNLRNARLCQPECLPPQSDGAAKIGRRPDQFQLHRDDPDRE